MPTFEDDTLFVAATTDMAKKESKDGVTFHYDLPGGSFDIDVVPSDFTDIHSLMRKLEEFAQKAGFPGVTITRANDDPWDPTKWVYKSEQRH